MTPTRSCAGPGGGGIIRRWRAAVTTGAVALGRRKYNCSTREVPIRVRPDWVCEVLSPSNSRNDLFKKLRTYQRCKVPHYWIVDPETETLMVYRWTTEGYLLVLAAEREDRVRPEPFDAIVLKVGALFDDDEDEEERQR
ncbi:Uma2 family endonuclease [Sorangium sp. So ce124]|uniref:Uma2 family endonuclease n=1 Tax=Sorangium sp. So ce124 TaxID=3133280 RepID=UPI003F5F8F50